MVLSLTDIQLFKILKEKVGEQEAEALVEYVDIRVKDGIKEANEQNLKVLATKEDISNLKLEITNLRAEFKTDIANSKADTIKWMFIFWIGQLAAFIAIAKFFFGK